MKHLARWLRRAADAIDYEGAPRPTHWSFTIEPGEGIRFREDGRGCPLWYRGNGDYLKAWDEAGPAPGAGDQWQRGHRHPYLKQEGPGP